MFFSRQPKPSSVIFVQVPMEKYTEKDFDWLLNLHKGSGSGSQSATRSKQGWKRPAFQISLVLSALFALIILPFFLLIRLSVYLNIAFGMSAWPALIGGITATICLLIVYLFIISFKTENKRLLMKIGSIGVSTMVLGYCLFSLFYLSGVHAKSADVRDVYSSMHPILRVAVSSVTLADSDLVITDIERIEEDYGRMGLPVNQTSRHYRQTSGYVHAVDIRTFDRGFIRNTLLRGSFELMGFRTIRHIGTADHLHVELRPTGL